MSIDLTGAATGLGLGDLGLLVSWGLKMLGFNNNASINGLEFTLLEEAEYTTAIQMTQHPVEHGANITDHAIVMPIEVVLTGYFSDNLGSAALALYSGGISGLFSDRSAISVLLKKQRDRAPVYVVFNGNYYKEMLITDIKVTDTLETANVTYAKVTLKQILYATAKDTTVSNDTQNDPSATGSPADKGTVTAQPAAGKP